jgi:hypothetical protein
VALTSRAGTSVTMTTDAECATPPRRALRDGRGRYGAPGQSQMCMLPLMDEDERAELISALQQSTVFGEGMLDLNQRLLRCVVARCEPARRRRDRVHACGAGALAGADGEATAADGEPDDRAAGSDP